MGRLEQAPFFFFADKVRLNLGRCSRQEEDSYAYRIFVLAHLSNVGGEGDASETEMTECALVTLRT